MKIPRLDLLSVESKKQRKLLLISSFIGFGVDQIGLVPSKIGALGIDFTTDNMKAVPIVLAISIVYFLSAFIIYLISDLVNLNKESLKTEDAFQEEFIGDLFEILKGYSTTDFLKDQEMKFIWLGFIDYVVTELKRPFNQSFGSKIIDITIDDYVTTKLKEISNENEKSNLKSILNKMGDIIKVEANQQCFNLKYENLQEETETKVYNIRFYFDAVLPIIVSIFTLIILFIN
ncbi:hypothetical protein ACFLS4_03755 [Bacteroidota bacterium]